MMVYDRRLPNGSVVVRVEAGSRQYEVWASEDGFETFVGTSVVLPDAKRLADEYADDRA
jgi:hypothetical protein